MRGGSTGILLVHGFTGSPAELLLLGEFLNRAGFTVLGVRLAGHATNEMNLQLTTRADWFRSVLDGYALLRGVCDKIFVIGHSMGALLSLKLSTLKKVDRLVTISPPIFLDESQHAELLPPREKCDGLFVKKSHRKLPNVPSAVNQTYRQMPLLSVHELVALIEEVKKILPQVKVPLLILHGTEDHTAKISSAEFVLNSVASSVKKFLAVEGGGHLIPLTEFREQVFEEALEFCSRD